MALDDRNFEKALARHLRSSASSGAHSNAFGVSPREACPDTETLAAYHDGFLSSEELVHWKQHVVACENCQLILAHLETPLEVPLDAAKKEFVAASQRPASSAAASVAPVPVVRPRRPPSMRWLWLVPAGAAAASLIAWVSLHQQKPLQLTQPNTVEVAEDRSATAAPPAESLTAPATRVAPTPQHREKERKEKDQPAGSSAGGVVSAPSTARDEADKQLNNRVQLTQQAPNQNAAAPSHGPSLSQQKQQQQQLMVSPGVVAGASRGAVLDQKKSASPAPSHPQEGAKEATAPAPDASERNFLADETVTPPAPAPQPAPPAAAPASSGAAATSKQQNADAVSSAAETAEVTSAAPSMKMMRAALLQDPHVFSAPDKKHFWRVGPVGLLEISGNRGGKWKPQVSGVTTDLVAGFATSAKVAWVVGRSGTILRTTDSGVLWVKLNSPDPGDLAGIIAADAMNAKIWFVPDEQTHATRTYQTTDGGATWSIVPN